MAGNVRTVDPAIEPVTLTEFKAHIRVTDDAENTLHEGLIETARISVEHKQKRQLITATFEETLDEFPAGPIILPWPPLIAISSITYIDLAGDSQTWAGSNYQTDTTSERGSVRPVPTASYPTTQAGRVNAVTVTYTAGYGATAATVPAPTKTAIKMLAAHLDEHRELVVVGATINEFPDSVANLVEANALKFF